MRKSIAALSLCCPPRLGKLNSREPGKSRLGQMQCTYLFYLSCSFISCYKWPWQLTTTDHPPPPTPTPRTHASSEERPIIIKTTQIRDKQWLQETESGGDAAFLVCVCVLCGSTGGGGGGRWCGGALHCDENSAVSGRDLVKFFVWALPQHILCPSLYSSMRSQQPRYYNRLARFSSFFLLDTFFKSLTKNILFKTCLLDDVLCGRKALWGFIQWAIYRKLQQTS